MKKTFFLICSLFLPCIISGQEKEQSNNTGKTIVFEYDSAGNRIARKVKDTKTVTTENVKEDSHGPADGNGNEYQATQQQSK